MRAIVAQANALRPDLIVQTGDMIDISKSYIPPYVRAFRDLSAPLGVDDEAVQGRRLPKPPVCSSGRPW